MKKIKKLLAVFAAVGVALMLPLQTMAAVDLNAKYDIRHPTRSRDGRQDRILPQIPVS